MAAKDSLYKGYGWVLGDGRSINAVRDPWIKHKKGFCANQNEDYGVEHVSVAEFINPISNSWDENRILNFFCETDAQLILATTIPNGTCTDRLAWTRTTNSQYSVKTGYQLWYDHNMRNDDVIQAPGWSKLWRLDIPHKMKIFLWRFCRNNVPVRRRLSTKGVSLPITCPMCDLDIEHKLHVFFDCPFAARCWEYVGVKYDMSSVEFAPEWLLNKLSYANHEEVVVIAKVLWGVWFFRNKKVWENRTVSAAVAMDWSSQTLNSWKQAKADRAKCVVACAKPCQPFIHRWIPPKLGMYKLNTDAAFKDGSDSFSIGLVLRDHLGALVAGKVMCLKTVCSVFEAEATAIYEGMHWLTTLPYQLVEIESDAMLAVQALKSNQPNHLEVGYTLDACRQIFRSRPGLSISFAKRQANKAAHLMARIPCLLDCQSVFTSPPFTLLETLMYDAKFD